MIEVRRDLYMDEETGVKNNRFLDTKNKIKLAMKSFRQQLTRL